MNGRDHIAKVVAILVRSPEAISVEVTMRDGAHVAHLAGVEHPLLTRIPPKKAADEIEIPGAMTRNAKPHTLNKREIKS